MRRHKNHRLQTELDPHWAESDLLEKKFSEIQTFIIYSVKAPTYFTCAL